MSVGMNISELRRINKMSEEQLAQRLCVDEKTVKSWEQDLTSPTLEQLIGLTEVFGVSVDEIISSGAIKADKYNPDSLDTV